MVNLSVPAPADREAVVVALAELLLAALEAEDRAASISAGMTPQIKTAAEAAR